MPFYLHQWKYKDEQIKRMLEEAEDLDREEFLRAATAVFQGEVHAFYFCFGEFDGVAITEFRDEKGALACAMSVFGQGRVHTVQTTPLFPTADGMEAIRRAQRVIRGAKSQFPRP